jgi:hypothetical protein
MLGDGKNKLFNDSKLGVWMTGLVATVLSGGLDSLIEAVGNTDLSHSEGWWTKLAAGALATALGLLTAYKARRTKKGEVDPEASAL